jgi:hypothetical protein
VAPSSAARYSTPGRSEPAWRRARPQCATRQVGPPTRRARCGQQRPRAAAAARTAERVLLARARHTHTHTHTPPSSSPRARRPHLAAGPARRRCCRASLGCAPPRGTAAG